MPLTTPTPADPSLITWIGKTYGGSHPALFHLMDVGAVAQQVLSAHPVSSDPGVNQAAMALIALHDLGKFSASFQNMLTEKRPQTFKHWVHTRHLLALHDNLLAAHLGGEAEARETLIEAIAGHHGGPWMGGHYSNAEISPQGIEAARMAMQIILALFPDADLSALDEEDEPRLSWQINGATVQCDWIGSNLNWFPATTDLSPQTYWPRAQQQARAALAETGLYNASPCPATILPNGAHPRPMQAAVQQATLPDGPMIAVIEDSTGAGKTEAALILANRMMVAGKARGIFFALPTMATSNAMFDRMPATAAQMFSPAPTLGLMHGKSGLNPGFAAICQTPDPLPHCTEWLADNRRQTLFADVGVGTIDQALLAVLPTRFNGVRHRALNGKILIIDEAHSYDPYMAAELRCLLRAHHLAGGSAIVLTATLPAQTKAELLAGFQQGTRRRPPKIDPQEDAPYPALTLMGTNPGQGGTTPVIAAPESHKRTQITPLHDVDAALNVIAQAQSTGAATLWVRNAVQDAIEAKTALAARGIKAELLHARFTLSDRLSRETALMGRFGPQTDGQGGGRKGRVLIATQVAEQSLDLDFDVMISDIAPVGAVIQRAGRLWRHMGARPANTRPVPAPVLYLLAPPLDQATHARWLHGLQPKGAYVYPQDVQWRSLKALTEAGEIVAPDGLRPLIEAVHGAHRPPVPKALENEELAQEGRALAEAAMARQHLITPCDPFHQPAMQRVWDEEKFPTRLGIPQITLVLARQDGAQLSPLAPEGWAHSEVQLPLHKAQDLTLPDQSAPAIATTKADWPRARRDYMTLCPVEEGGQICPGLRYDPTLGLLY